RCAGCTQQPYANKVCHISLSRPLLELRPLEDLLETLLHEMIHAYLWVTDNHEQLEHGPKFHAEMKRIEKESGMKLEVFHEFYSEYKFNPRIEGELREFISKTWKIPEEAMKKPASPPGSDFSSDNSDLTLSPSWGSNFDFFGSSDFSTDEEPDKFASNEKTKMKVPKAAKSVTPLMENKTPVKSVTPLKENRSPKTTARVKPVTLPKENRSQGKSVTPPKENRSPKTSSPVRLSKENRSAESSSKTATMKKKKLLTNGKTKMASKFTEIIKKYKWQCYGACQNEAPMFGRIERLINRPPNTSEKWFLLHEKNCGGSFVRFD
ncbi:DNA-dependent metalloprotease SPRTN, partial [Octopus bimaculoides]